ncbi:class I SAM-dependent methyltransferase [Haloferula luteola]|uniref:class I SAM-dependent methyltransferase n=1 Tax=Haloferula luteola TaxID=595692 RepID=UPI00161EF9CC|nr:SAM-dependent methyltransferase [Haloferula luteola]
MLAELHQEIVHSSGISFARFMEAALYHPEGGYYARPGRQVGRLGDFFTSVSVGPLFGQLLAQHLASFFSHQPGPVRILELGAHDGQLARDILEALTQEHPDLLPRLEYAIIEPLPSLAARQRELLAPFSAHLRIVETPHALDPRPGILVANELIDALTCHRIESTGDGWDELGVGLDPEGSFIWKSLGPAAPPLIFGLPSRPAGYRTEVRPQLAAFLAPLAPCISPGKMLFIDYGFEREDYFDPARTDGTLETFQAHRRGGHPLQDPGSRDLTAHVDFSALREALEALGGQVEHFTNQARFLTEIARPWLLKLEGRTDRETAKLLRNFQTLTHPAQLGSRFHIMEASFR